MSRTTFVWSLLFVLGIYSEAHALGSDHTKEQIAAQGKTCVHGYWINSSDVYFHAGDVASLNQYLAKQNAAKLNVVFHTGTKKARSPWDTADRPLPVDWTITTGPMVTGNRTQADRIQVDVWLGGKFKRAEVTVPAEATVTEAGK